MGGPGIFPLQGNFRQIILLLLFGIFPGLGLLLVGLVAGRSRSICDFALYYFRFLLKPLGRLHLKARQLAYVGLADSQEVFLRHR